MFMAADDGRPRASYSAQVCATCKARKKKCDKVLPSCGYCVRRRLRNPAISFDNNRSPTTSAVGSSTPAATLWPTTSEATLFHQVHNLIRDTGQFVDDLTSRYFQGVHRYLPVISRARFHTALLTPGDAPSADFSILLLCICLVASPPKPGFRNHEDATDARPVDRGPLHLAAKSLFAQVQGSSSPPSVRLIQAGLLLALYEYMQGRPDEAFASISSIARLAYSARIHVTSRPLPQPLTGSDTDLELQAEEAANTWWGIITCERIFFCEVAVFEQPLVTAIPSRDFPLPTEPSILRQSDVQDPEPKQYVPVSALSSIDIGPFGRSTQAVWLLDRVLKGLDIPDFDSRLEELQGLDTTLREFLGVTVRQRNGERGIFCEAVAIALRALLTLHRHILRQAEELVGGEKTQSLETYERSHAALDTTTRMIIDVADALENSDPYVHTSLAPTYPYTVRAALEHVGVRTLSSDDDWARCAEVRLREALGRCSHYSHVKVD